MKHSEGSRLTPIARPRLWLCANVRTGRDAAILPSAFASAATANSRALTIMSNWPRKSKQATPGAGWRSLAFQEKAIKLLALDAGASGSLGHAVSKLTYPDAAAEIMI